ncbi:MAG: hypothetical protein KC657_30260 [Myxococcales bacterium]|nr:hypothetical protein [Myxococcales bacterium]
MRHQDLLRHYHAARPALQERAEHLRESLAAWLADDASIKVHSVTARLKAPESLALKLERPDKSYDDLWDITDLVGLRVITYFEDAVDRVGQVLEARLPIDFQESTDKRRRRDESAFGYRSLHYVFRLGGELPARARAEVQVRTVLEHAWAEIEHDLGYKAREAMPASARRRLSRVAGLLELADQEFVAIRRELEAYASVLPARVANDDDALPLDRLSLTTLLACDDVRDLDVRIAGALGKPLGDKPFFVEYLLKMLAAGGVRTVAEARSGLREHGARIEAMVGPYFAFASRTWSLSAEQMETVYRGYSLFFLAHVTALRASSLGIDKVERLAHLYREMDYPDDARAAQRVASLLVEAFGDVA